jgi:hypothetical protein
MLLERASVIGKEFHYRAVIDLSPVDDRGDAAGRLFSLVRKDLVQPIPSDQGEDMLAFRHDLIRVAAYEAIPKAVRAELHERFADWLEKNFAEQINELEEIVGYHLEQTTRFRISSVAPTAPRTSSRCVPGRDWRRRVGVRSPAVTCPPRRSFLSARCPCSMRTRSRRLKSCSISAPSRGSGGMRSGPTPS